MISQILPHLLHATKAELSRRMGVEYDPALEIPVAEPGRGDMAPIVPETLHMTVPGKVPVAHLAEVVTRACAAHGSEVEIINVREGEINLVDRVRADIYLPGRGELHIIAFTTQGSVSFISIT